MRRHPPKSHSSPSPSHSVAHYWSFAEGGSPETGVHDQRPLHHTQRPHTHNLSTRSSSLSTSTSHLPPLSLLSPPSSPLSLVVLFPWAEIGHLPFATPGSPGCKGSRRDSVGAFLYNCELSPPPKPPAFPSASETSPPFRVASGPLAARPSRSAPLSLNTKLTPFPTAVL